jgi:hypothetical protein
MRVSWNANQTNVTLSPRESRIRVLGKTLSGRLAYADIVFRVLQHCNDIHQLRGVLHWNQLRPSCTTGVHDLCGCRGKTSLTVLATGALCIGALPNYIGRSRKAMCAMCLRSACRTRSFGTCIQVGMGSLVIYQYWSYRVQASIPWFDPGFKLLHSPSPHLLPPGWLLSSSTRPVLRMTYPFASLSPGDLCLHLPDHVLCRLPDARHEAPGLQPSRLAVLH